MSNSKNNLTKFRSQILLIPFVLVAHCSDKPPIPILGVNKPQRVAFSSNWEAPIAIIDPQVFRLSDGTLVGARPTPDGVMNSFSTDDGLTWTKPVHLDLCGRALVPLRVSKTTLWYLSVERTLDGGQFYIHARLGEIWNAPSPVRDTHWGGFSVSTFALDSLGRIYVTWSDAREGNPDIYFSLSSDTGRTWSRNVRINDDQTGQEQREPCIVASPDGMLCILWADNRSALSLFDIYASTSSDGGRTWSRNRKVNDDTTYTWQVSPTAVYDGRSLGVVWMDYRDPNPDGVIHSRIYSAQSKDGGLTWTRNIRVSENIDGNSSFPGLFTSGTDSIHCLWIDSEHNILGDVVYAYSHDGGTSWSATVKVNDDTGRVAHYHRRIGWLGADRSGQSVVGWIDFRKGTGNVYMARLGSFPDSLPLAYVAPQKALNPPPPQAFSYRTKRLLLQDSFVTNPSRRWKVLGGTWVWSDGMFIGYGSRRPCALTGSASWSDYEFTGLFKLDRFDHRASYIYLRSTNERALRYYRIANLFRRGVKVEYFDGQSFFPIAEVLCSVEADRWYRFKAVVRGTSLNYFIDDVLRISSTDLHVLQQGKVGLGSETSPVYFKDIAVREVL